MKGWTNIAIITLLALAGDSCVVDRVAPSTNYHENTQTRLQAKIDGPKYMKYHPETTSSRGEGLNVNPWIDGIATWYDGANDGINGSGTGLTSTGTIPTNGRTAAVDPTIIPYGSHFEVMFDDGSVEYLVAEDCGGAIRGNRIDIFNSDPNECMKNGRKHVRIRIIIP